MSFILLLSYIYEIRLTIIYLNITDIFYKFIFFTLKKFLTSKISFLNLKKKKKIISHPKNNIEIFNCNLNEQNKWLDKICHKISLKLGNTKTK